MNSLSFLNILIIAIVLITKSKLSNSQQPHTRVNGIYQDEQPKCLTFDYKERFSQEMCGDVHSYYKAKSEKVHAPSLTAAEIEANSNIDWSNIVLVMIIHAGDGNMDRMIKEHYETWLQHTGPGLDVLLVTDTTDNRRIEDIIPADINKDIKSHLYKSKVSSIPSNAKESEIVKYKVIDAFLEASYQFIQDDRKQYFIKIDYDAYVISEHLLSFVNKIHKTSSVIKKLPAAFGKAVCMHEVMCYSSGALYGLNRHALRSTVQYILSHSFNQFDGIKSMFNPEYDLLEHEEFVISYAYRMATHFPVIHNPHMFELLLTASSIESSLGSKKNPPISFHGMKDRQMVRDYDGVFYFKNGKLRPFGQAKLDKLKFTDG